MSTAVSTSNGDSRQQTRIVNYSKHWADDSAQDSAANTESRKAAYKEVVNGYYDGATELYEYGWGKSFHFCRFSKDEAFNAAIARHQHYLAASTGIKAGMRVLDVGCGVGGPAREIHKFTDANIVGITINEFQVQRARKYTKAEGFEDSVEFVQGDFLSLVDKFGPNSFDAVYAIEATCHAPEFEDVYSQIYKVLKPGGRFGLYEWCMTDAWDPSIPEHKLIAHNIEKGDGIPEMRSIQACSKALKNVGFEIVHQEDLAARKDYVEWFYPLEGNFSKAQSIYDYAMCFRTTAVGKFITQTGVSILERAGFVPKGTHDVGEQLKLAADGLVAGGKAKLFTPMMHFVSVKKAE